MPTPVPLADLFTAEDWFTLLDVSLTGIHLARPVYASNGTELVDFVIEYVNPAGQRMTGLPEQPGDTLLNLFPHTVAAGIFHYYRRVFETGESATHKTNYQADGLDNYFCIVARRSGERLVVSFTDTSDQDHSAVEQAMRESQATEQHAQAVAEQQRHRFREVLTQMPAYIAVYQGPDHIYQFVNPAYQSLFPHRSFLGRPFREGTPESVELGVVALFDQVYQTGKPVYLREMEGWFDFHSNGQPEQVFLNISLHPLRNVQGHIDGVLDFTYDVSQQVRARQQVEQLNQELEARVQARTQEAEAARDATERQRRQWEELFRTAPAGICIFDGPEWVYQFVNPGYQALFPGRELLGKRLVDALPEVADQPLMAILHHVYDTGEPFQETEVLVPLARYEGGPVENIYFDLTYLVRRNEEGQIDGFVTYADDVTEQVLARQEREAQRRQLVETFAQAPVAICVFRGPAYLLELVNTPMGDMLGHPPASLLGQPFFEALPELTNQGLREVLDHVRQTGNSFVAQERAIHLAYRPEEIGYYNYTYQPLRDEQGLVAAITCVAVDVTQQVRARQQVQDLNQELAAINEELAATNEELHESNTQLTRTNVELDTFVYTASHDLKAPITNIEGIVLALRETLPTAVLQDELIAHLLDLLNQTLARFQLTIGHLTDISRLQLAYTGPVEPVVLATVVEDVRLDLAAAIAAASTKLTVAVAPEMVVSFSPASLRSIVYNLLSNAIKYRAPERPSQVQVSATQTAQGVELTVQDNGLGMSALQQRQLFGLFQRLHTHVEGTGVGLYITKRLIENAGGTIAVQSQPNVGTTFTVTLPY
jgi:PAS domain S-box-containing protein